LNESFFKQHQNSTGRHQLGAGEHSENVVFLQSDSSFFVGKSTAECVDNISTPKQSGGDTWQELLVNLRLHGRVERVETLIRHPVSLLI
jgi:hypothetical protein